MTTDKEDKTGFYPRYLEAFIKALRQLRKADWTLELQERYLGKEKYKGSNN